MNLFDRPPLQIGYVGVAFDSYFAEEYDQYNRAINGLTALAERLDFELVPVRYPVTNLDLAERAAAELRAGGVDFLMIECASVASGELLIPLADVAPRLGVWGTPDPEQEGPIKLHSLVSVNHYTSIIAKHLGAAGLTVKWFYGHVDDPEFLRRFEITATALRAIKQMSQARIGWIGGNSPGFYNMNFDAEVILERLGTQIVAHDFTDIVTTTNEVDDARAAQIVGDLTAAAADVLTSDELMVKGARLYLALKEIASVNRYSAMAVQCWPKFQDFMEIAPCMAYSWLGSEDDFAVSCEGDVPGALSMLLLNELNDIPGSSTLLDMTAIDKAANSILMWHCGVSPRHFANADGITWIDHPTLGRKSPETYGVAGDQVFAAQEATIAYIGSDASELLIVGTRIEERPVKGFEGTRGWFTDFRLNGEPISLDDLVNTLIVGGHEHHYAMARGDLTDVLLEVAAWLDMRTVSPRAYKDYLQKPEVTI